MVIVIGLTLFTVFAAIGLATRNAGTVQSLTPPFFLFLFVSSGLIPVATLPGWLQAFARNQPISVSPTPRERIPAVSGTLALWFYRRG